MDFFFSLPPSTPQPLYLLVCGLIPAPAPNKKSMHFDCKRLERWRTAAKRPRERYISGEKKTAKRKLPRMRERPTDRWSLTRGWCCVCEGYRYR